MCSVCVLKRTILLCLMWLYFSRIFYNNRRLFWVDDYYDLRMDYGFDNFILPNMLRSQTVTVSRFFHMTYSQFCSIYQQLTPLLSTNANCMRTDRLSVREKVAVALRFFATGDSYSSLEAFFKISSSTISKLIPEVSKAIITKMGPINMKLPRTEDEWKRISDQFASDWQFPNCLGAVDGKHIGEYGSQNEI